jgi:hypothetical protein
VPARQAASDGCAAAVARAQQPCRRAGQLLRTSSSHCSCTSPEAACPARCGHDVHRPHRPMSVGLCCGLLGCCRAKCCRCNCSIRSLLLKMLPRQQQHQLVWVTQETGVRIACRAASLRPCHCVRAVVLSVAVCCAGVLVGCYANGFRTTTTQWLTGSVEGLVQSDAGDVSYQPVCL